MLNRKLLCTTLVAAFATCGLSAHAQDRDDHRAYERHDQYRHDDRAMDRRAHDRDGRWAEHRDRDARAMGGPGHHHWHRGDRLPDEYRHGGYVDWRHHHLHRPPHGYQWVEVDGNYALVALGSGVITDVIVRGR